MTPEDTPVPGDDAIARAAREGLSHLAGSHALLRLDWESVATSARRVRQRRLVALVAACALVLATSGAAVAATNANGDHLFVEGHGALPKTTTTNVPTSTSTSVSAPTTTTVTTPDSTALSSGPDVTSPTGPVRVAVPGDFTGTITTASTTWIVGQPEPVALTVRNASDHAVTLPQGTPSIGLYFDFLTNVEWGSFDEVTTLAPGDERTFRATLGPNPDMIGTKPLRAAFVRGIVKDIGGYADAFLDGVPTVMITTIPPGWTLGDALDPAQGAWSADVSADSPQATVGEPLTLHVDLTNLDSTPHNTDGFGHLGIVCDGSHEDNGVFLDAATLAPGGAQSFTVEITPTENQIGPYACSLGIAYDPEIYAIPGRGSIEADAVTVTVRAESATTTSPSTTTTTAAP